ncbi:hypothetical protein NEISICOT_03078 [Neisseria sicca ATCC 29256]|uniref:Uncharacterized protein n=1 Tax=Neisseria sicca ATCC 29256 TaxID=547045 RepID=C6M953_NEISI|nr:hypothetical protein NEISICOT_03078 [Neisseria sicca ATCC 29256]
MSDGGFAGKAHATNLSYPQARFDSIKRSSENLKIRFSDDLSFACRLI